MSELVVSLTTIPSRIPHLGQFLQSLKRQTLKPDRIELNVPAEYKRQDMGQAELNAIPSEFSVHICEDVGPATKLLPTLQRYRDTDTMIVYCDDDRIYSDNWLERLTYFSALNPDNAISEECMPVRMVALAYRGTNKNWAYRLKRVLSLGLYQPYALNRAMEPDVAEGFGGVLVKPAFFTDRVFDVPKECWAVDDIWISANLHLTGHPIFFTDRPTKFGGVPLEIEGKDLGRGEDALTVSSIEGNARHALNFHAVKYCIKELGVWSEYADLFE